MRRIRDVMRLKHAHGLSERQIAASLPLGKGTVGAYLGRARKAGLGWPLPPTLSDDDLELLLFPAVPSVPDHERPVPDWASVDRELRRPGGTRTLLWEEYRAAHPLGFGYAWFCEHYEAWRGACARRCARAMWGARRSSSILPGDTIEVIDPASGEARAMKLFVAAMGASSYTYAEAVATEGLEDWIGAHVRMFAFLGGVPKVVVVPDNLKAAVLRVARYDPGLNRAYAEMAEHYGTAVLPARPRKPRDKAKVEVAVQVAQRWIVVSQTRLRHDARLRNRRFFSLAELNAAIRRLRDELNMRQMRGYGASRADLFATLDRPHLQPLPAEAYAFASWKRARVAPDYHVEVDSSWYSVPFGLIRQEVDVRTCGEIVEVFHKGQRVASHLRCKGRERPCDAARSHTLRPQAPCEMDPGPNAGPGREAGAIRHRVLRGGHGGPSPSRAGLQNLHGRSGPGQKL